MAKLDRSFVADDDMLRNGEEAVHSIYGNEQKKVDVNKLHHAIFVTRTTNQTWLSSCRDACDKHIKRANYQAAIFTIAQRQNQ